ncbi:putative d-tyrosyl-trna deacylase [Phaeomoniella chlamydospora]|uniref:D-aminoacyl-tRNA deacylase n=1 Tax=Phaeomoniella chlamydospora TaxID=158046 RepID=A0A0G2E6T9_PHACM|nr:putative d-tyrosyl-trna deacylase [Phaeomoniella chlamydospora]
MKAVIQRVASASVTVDKQLISSIGKGLLVFAAFGPDDTKKDADTMASKVLKLKIWPDETDSGWKRSVQDIQGEVLCVSQFTLYASTKKGNKPDFHGAAKSEIAKELYDYFFTRVQHLYSPEKVKNGVFQAMMEVGIVNDGPVTINIDTDRPKPESSRSKSGETVSSSREPGESSSVKTKEDLESIINKLPQELLD